MVDFSSVGDVGPILGFRATCRGAGAQISAPGLLAVPDGERFRSAGARRHDETTTTTPFILGSGKFRNQAKATRLTSFETYPTSCSLSRRSVVPPRQRNREGGCRSILEGRLQPNHSTAPDVLLQGQPEQGVAV